MCALRRIKYDAGDDKRDYIYFFVISDSVLFFFCLIYAARSEVWEMQPRELKIF